MQINTIFRIKINPTSAKKIQQDFAGESPISAKTTGHWVETLAILKEHLPRISKLWVNKLHFLGARERYWRLHFISCSRFSRSIEVVRYQGDREAISFLCNGMKN